MEMLKHTDLAKKRATEQKQQDKEKQEDLIKPGILLELANKENRIQELEQQNALMLLDIAKFKMGGNS